MKTRNSLVAITLLLSILPFFASAQPAPLALGLAPLSNKSQNQNLDVVALMAGSSIDLSLRLLGSFQLSPIAAADLTAARAAAERGGLAGVLFGSVEEAPDGSIKLSAALFDRLKDSLSYSQTETAATLLDVFEASDLLTEKLVEALAGRRVGFGALELALTPPGAAGLSVLLNGTPLGLAEGRLPPIPAGDYTLELRQKRFGKEVGLLKQALTIKENQKSRVELQIPELTEEERTAFKAFDKEIMDLIPEKPEEASKRLRTMTAAIEEISPQHQLVLLKGKYKGWDARLAGQKSTPEAKPAGNIYDIAAVFGDTNAIVDPEGPVVSGWKQQFNMNLEDFPPVRGIRIDGELDDWKSLKPMLKDIQNDNFLDQRRPRSDLKAFYFAQDAETLYFAIENYDGNWNQLYGAIAVFVSLILTYPDSINSNLEFRIRETAGGMQSIALQERGKTQTQRFIPIECRSASVIECAVPLKGLGNPRSVEIQWVAIGGPVGAGGSWANIDLMSR